MYNAPTLFASEMWGVKGKMYRSGCELYILEARGALTSCLGLVRFNV